jgi:TonB family protein
MIFKFTIGCVALASASLAQPAPEPRAPTGKWHVRTANSQCIALRSYGTDSGSPQLLLKAPARGEVMQVAVLRDAARTMPGQVDATIAVGEHPPLKTSLMMFSANSKQRIYLLNMPSAEFAIVRQATTLSLRSEGLNETFALSQMEPMLKGMEQCVANLRREFNIGAEPTGGRAARAKVNLAKLFNSRDYPASASRRGQGGRVEFTLLILEDGRVADCTLIKTSGVPVLDAQVCVVLKVRAKFQPALGSDGKPIKDSSDGAIVWRW